MELLSDVAEMLSKADKVGGKFVALVSAAVAVVASGAVVLPVVVKFCCYEQNTGKELRANLRQPGHKWQRYYTAGKGKGTTNLDAPIAPALCQPGKQN